MRGIASGVVLLAGAAAVAVAASRQITIHDAAIRGPSHGGADSSRIASFLSAMATTDPVVCDLIGDQLGNFWYRTGGSTLGRLADAPPTQEATKDSLAGGARDAGGVAVLVAALRQDDPCVRRVAGKLLGHSGALGTARLEALLGDASPRVREAAAYAAGIGEAAAVRGTLERLLGDAEVAVAAMAAWALGELEDPASVVPLARVVRHDQARLRLAAVWALARMEEPRVGGLLLAALDDRDAAVRAVAAEGVGDHEVAGAREALERMVARDASADVRRAAAEALGQLEDARSLDALAQAIGDADRDVRLAAVEAIGDLDGTRTAPAALVRALTSDDRDIRRAAVEAVAHIADPATIGPLAALLDDRDVDIRRAAVEGLGEIGTAAVVPALTKALKDADPDVRRSAVEALGEIKSD